MRHEKDRLQSPLSGGFPARAPNSLKSVPKLAACPFSLRQVEGSGDGGQHGSPSASSPPGCFQAGEGGPAPGLPSSPPVIHRIIEFCFSQKKSSGVFLSLGYPEVDIVGSRSEGLWAFLMGALHFVLTRSKSGFLKQAGFEQSSSIWEDQSLEQTLGWKMSWLLLVGERL